MAEERSAGAPALDTNIESGGFDEKRQQQEHSNAPVGGAAPPPKAKPEEEEEEDEDMDALIEDLESQDGHDDVEEEEEGTPGGGRVIPEDMLQTDSRVGLTESEVTARRRKYGLNQMKEEKENLILKFFGYFIGPIQFVMEVSHSSLLYCCAFRPLLCFWGLVFCAFFFSSILFLSLFPPKPCMADLQLSSLSTEMLSRFGSIESRKFAHTIKFSFFFLISHNFLLEVAFFLWKN